MQQIKMKIVNTPFYLFMNSSGLVVDAYLSDDICTRYEGDDIFCFGPMDFTCTDDNFAKILGLLNYGEKQSSLVD